MPHFSQNIVTNIVEVSFLNCLGRVTCHTFTHTLILRHKGTCIFSNGIEGDWRHQEESLIFGGSYGSYTFRKTFQSWEVLGK